MPCSTRRSADFPEAPRPCAPSLLRLVLQAAGSSPGFDGQPYEIYHEGSLFVAALLAQAMYMAPWPAILPLILGPGLDLAVWIPKALASLRAAGLRPLQLPPCMRRLFGAAIGAIAGPRIEPQLSPHQTAIRGGDCGANIRAMFRHLERPPILGARPSPGPLWDAVV